MGIVDNFKETAKLVQQLGNMDLYRQILDLQGEAMELTEQLRSKDEVIRVLQAKLEIKDKLVFVKWAYFMKNSDGQPILDEPYCPKCYDVDKVLCRLQPGTGYGHCPNCTENFNHPGCHAAQKVSFL